MFLASSSLCIGLVLYLCDWTHVVFHLGVELVFILGMCYILNCIVLVYVCGSSAQDYICGSTMTNACSSITLILVLVHCFIIMLG